MGKKVIRPDILFGAQRCEMRLQHRRSNPDMFGASIVIVAEPV